MTPGTDPGGARLVQLGLSTRQPADQRQPPLGEYDDPTWIDEQVAYVATADARQPIPRAMANKSCARLRRRTTVRARCSRTEGRSVTQMISDRAALADGSSTCRLPTDEQVAVIESPLRPAVVIAGAGSGKTETMADRVVWLVANRLVRPDEVLGLTFTRKAAAELGRRIRRRLAQWRRVVERDAPDDLDSPGRTAQR